MSGTRLVKTTTEKLELAAHCIESSIKALTPAGIMAFLTKAGNEQREQARQHSENPDQVNSGQGEVVSAVGAIIEGATGLRLANSFFMTQAWKYLNKGELAAIGTLTALGLASTVCNAINFGCENHIIQNGSVAGFAGLNFEFANSITQFGVLRGKGIEAIAKAKADELAAKNDLEAPLLTDRVQTADVPVSTSFRVGGQF